MKKSKSCGTTAANRFGKTERVQYPFHMNTKKAIEYLQYFGKRIIYEENPEVLPKNELRGDEFVVVCRMLECLLCLPLDVK